MKQGRKNPYEKGVAIRSAPSFAECTVRCIAKRKQGIGGLGIELRKLGIRTLTLLRSAEGNMGGGDIASPSSVLRSHRPQARLETSCTRTGRLRRGLLPNQATGRRVKAQAPGHAAEHVVAELAPLYRDHIVVRG